MNITIDDDEILEYVRKTYDVDTVFDIDELRAWAEKNGYEKIEE